MIRPLSFVSLCLIALTAPAPMAVAQNGSGTVLSPSPTTATTLEVPAGQSRVLRFPAITRAAIGNPAVADIAILSKTEILLNAKAPGETLLYVPNARGTASVTVRVLSTGQTTAEIEAQVNRALQGTGVTARSAGTTVLLSGTVSSPEEEQRALAVAKAITPNVQSLIRIQLPTAPAVETLTSILQPMGITVRSPGANMIVLEGKTTPAQLEKVNKIVTQLGTGYTIVNMVADTALPQQVVIHARVVDIDQAALRDIGFDWGSLRYDDEGRLVGVGQPVIIGEAGGTTHDLDGGGPLRRLENIGAEIRALEQGNRAKILSSPDILVVDNKPAKIIVGGEIPVPVPQLGAGANVIVIDYKEYGVKLEVTPRVLDDGNVSLRIQPEVSTLDYANAVVISGFRIPGFRVRRADTEVNVASGQTIMIGGLLQDSEADTMRKVPILGDIPILGELFRFRAKSRGKTQLVVLVTPEILPAGTVPPLSPLANTTVAPVKLDPVIPGLDPTPNEAPVFRGLPDSGPTPIPSTPRPVGANTSKDGVAVPASSRNADQDHKPSLRLL